MGRLAGSGVAALPHVETHDDEAFLLVFLPQRHQVVAYLGAAGAAPAGVEVHQGHAAVDEVAQLAVDALYVRVALAHGGGVHSLQLLPLVGHGLVALDALRGVGQQLLELAVGQQVGAAGLAHGVGAQHVVAVGVVEGHGAL